MPPEDLRQVHPVKPDVGLSRYDLFTSFPVLERRCLYTAALCRRLSGYAFWEQDNIHGYLLLHHHIIMEPRP